MKRKLITALSAALALMMLITAIPFSVGAAFATPFEDVKADDYFCEAVIWAYGEGVTTGTTATKFAPQATCTRGQVVTFLWRAMGKPEPTSSVNPFEDVKASDYYFKPILWAVEKGITTGTSAKRFSPDVTCTNAHILTFIWRALGEPGKTGEGEWYADAQKWATDAGLLDGTYDGEYDVNAGCPRANVVTYLYRYMKDGTLTLYVSAGADASAADGSLEKPFATIEAARDYLRTADKSGYKAVTVRIGAGNYSIGNALTFTAEDSGTKDCPISYVGEPGAIVAGGVVLTAGNFTKANGGLTPLFPEEARDKIVMVDLTKCGFKTEDFTTAMDREKTLNYAGRALFLSVNGVRQTLAQYPNNTFLHVGETVTHSADGTTDTAVDHVTHQTINYGEEHFATVTSWSEKIPVFVCARLYKLWCPDDSIVVDIDKKNPTVDILFAGGHEPDEGTILYFYNVPEELDIPGEYLFDESGILYYYPTEEFQTATMTIPKSEGLVNITKAQNLTFKNLTFTCCVGDAVTIKGGNNISFIGCDVSAAKDQGFDIDGDNLTISGCAIHDTGSDAVSFTSGDIEMIKGGNLLIYNNDIYDFGVTEAYGYAVSGKGVDILVSHNDVHDGNFKGIHFHDAVNAVAEYNDVWRVSLLSEDTGVMSADGKQNFNIIFRYNFVHDCMPEGEAYKIKEVNPDYGYYGTFAFYYDNGCSYIETYSNVVNNVDTGYLSNGGRGNSCHNNLFIDCHKWYVEFSEWTYGNALNEDGSLDSTGKFDDYVYNDVWKKTNPDLAGLICDVTGKDTMDPMLWCAPAKNYCADNYIYYNKAERLFNNWGIRPYNIEGWVEKFNPDTMHIDDDSLRTEYSSKRTTLDIKDAVEAAQGVLGMDYNTFLTIGKVD